MDFIHFIDKSQLDSVLKNGIKTDDCYRGKGILVYPNGQILFKVNSTDAELIEDEKISNKLSNDEKWEGIGALGLRQNDKEVLGIRIQIPDSCWPMKVFIDIQHDIAAEFGKLLDEKDVDGIQYSTGNTLTEVISQIESSRFVLEGSFIVKEEKDLKELMEIFQNAGGGIWGAHSFDCMIETQLYPNTILEVIEFENRYNTV